MQFANVAGFIQKMPVCEVFYTAGMAIEQAGQTIA